MRDPKDYAKTRGMLLLKEYLPKVAPFSRFNVIDSLEEWESVKDNYGSFSIQRVDMPTGMPPIMSKTGGQTQRIPEILADAQAQNPEAVVLVMDTKEPSVYRYLYDGGFNVLFKPDDLIVIETVAEGFDAHELTRNKAVHERYVLRWKDAIFAKDRASLLKVSTNRYFVAQPQYAAQRNERIEFLVNSCGYDVAAVLKNIPQEVKRINDSLIVNLLEEIVLVIFEQKTEILLDGYTQFCVQGNFVNGRVQPWEFLTGRRWI